MWDQATAYLRKLWAAEEGIPNHSRQNEQPDGPSTRGVLGIKTAKGYSLPSCGTGSHVLMVIGAKPQLNLLFYFTSRKYESKVYIIGDLDRTADIPALDTS